MLLAGAAAAVAPFATRAEGVCTPRELAQRFDAAVAQRLDVPRNEARIYASLAEVELAGRQVQRLLEPQYLLLVDSCPFIQAAFLFWRLLPGRYELVGASPASTGSPSSPGCLETPCGVFPQAQAAPAGRAFASRVYDFGTQRARRASGAFADLRLQARAAVGASRTKLGTAQSDGGVLLPPSLVAFLDAYGVLDGDHAGRRTPQGDRLPFAGQYLVVIDSEREERPDWARA